MKYIEIDQSIKIDDTNGDTILAYSNEKYFSVLIPISIKRELFKSNPKFDKRDLRIKEIGRKSRAHEIAKKVHNKQIQPNRIITKQELINHI